MAADLPPVYFTIFWPFLIIFFVLLRGVAKLEWNRTLVGLLAGICFVLTFMNGVSALSRSLTVGAPLFILTQRLHWFAMVGCGILTVGVILQPKEWQWVLGITSGLLELIVGIPLAVVTAQNLGRFSLFSLAPIGCLILLVVLFWPGLWSSILFPSDPNLTEEGGLAPKTA